MNTYIKILSLIGIMGWVFASTSCKSKILEFGNETGVYIDKASIGSFMDSTLYSFAGKPEIIKEDTFFIPVRIAGLPATVDRIVPLLIVTDSSTAVEGKHYKKGDWIVKANEYAARLPLIIYRTADLSTNTLLIKLKMGTNEDFPLDIERTKSISAYSGSDERIYNRGYLLKINDMLTKPEKWDAAGSWLQTFFGNYSERKFEFIVEVTGRANWPPRGRDGEGAPTLNMFYNYRSLVIEALRLYELEHGPMMDENNVRVTFPD